MANSLALTFVLILTGPASAQKLDSSLSKVPADAIFYSSNMRLGEQLEIWHKSKAHAKLMSLPAIQFALKQAHAEMEKPGNPVAKLIAFAHAPENQELMALLHDLCHHEMFVYGGEDNVKLLQALGEIGGGMSTANVMRQMQGDRSPEAQIKSLLDGLKGAIDNIVAPDFVMGFRTKKSDAAKNLLPRLEAAINKALENAPKQFQGRLKREKIGDAEAISFVLDGTLIPWSKMKLEDLEDEKDEYKPVVDKLNSTKISLTIAVKGEYLLVSVGGGPTPINKFGAGSPLNTLPEFAPLAKFADQRIVSVSYVSKKFAEMTGTKQKDLEEMVQQAKDGLKQSGLSDELRDKIIKDLDTFFKEMASALPKPTSSMSFEFLNGKGVEGYAYQFGAASAIKPLTITDGMGGSPLLAAAGRGEDLTPGYKNFVKWIKIFYGHAEAAATELAPEQVVDQIKEGMKQILPFLQRFDEITGNQFLPSLADGQFGFVLDDKWTSKKWFPDVEQGGHELPMLEMGLLFGVSDAAKLVEALQGYRKLINDIMEMARPFSPGLPEEGIPAAQKQAAGSATAYFWPVPQEGQDASIQPNMAISKSTMSMSMSFKHAERLHSNKPLAGDWKALAHGNAIQEIGWVDYAGMIRMARPWVEKLGVPAMQKEMKDDAPEGLRKQDLPAQVSTMIDILGCLKSTAAVKYRDGNNTVYHHVTVMEDLK